VALEHRDADIAQPQALPTFGITQWLDKQAKYFKDTHAKRHAQNERFLLTIIVLFYLGVGLFVGIVQHNWYLLWAQISPWLGFLTPLVPRQLLTVEVGHLPWETTGKPLLAAFVLLTLSAFILRFRGIVPKTKSTKMRARFDKAQAWLTNLARRRPIVRWLARFYPLFWGSFPVIVGLWASYAILHDIPSGEALTIEKRLGLVVAFLNAGAAAVIYLREKLAIEPEARNYEEMKHVYRLAKELLGKTEDAGQRRLVLIELGREALAENAYWLRAHRERPIEQIPG